jgi:hypothetical protein
MVIKRADRRLGRQVEQFLKNHAGATAPIFVLLCWEAASDPGAPATDLHIITNADDATLRTALDVACTEIDDPSP